MTIRFTCAGCGSLLKIKDDLAGTDAKCPKCKTEFVVPDPEDQASDDSVEVLAAPSAKRAGSDAGGKSAKSDRPAEKPALKSEQPSHAAEKVSATAPTAPSSDESLSNESLSDDSLSNESLDEFDPLSGEHEVAETAETPKAVAKDDDGPSLKSDSSEQPVDTIEHASIDGSSDDLDSEDSGEVLVMAPRKQDPSTEKAEKPKVAEKPPARTEKSADKSPGKSVSKSKKSGGDDFDPADFLMGGGDGPRRPAPSFGNLSDPDADRPRTPAAESRPSRPSTGKAPTPGGSSDSISASSHAKDMMMRAMEESRAHAGDPHVEEKPEGFDFVGLFRELGLKGGAGVVGIIILCYGMYIMFDSMISTKLKLPKLGYVTGTVTLDGQPLQGATVYFAPMDATMADSKKDRARTSYGITDAEGHYKMIYINQTQGVAVGKCRVWLDLITPEGQKIPPNFTEGVLVVKEVKPGSQEIPFEMSSK
ncbi:MAG: hypothetical protein JSS49_27010 [Planctomycetes bacterium]|nr:hypothetical protein [Planctomycetota bacterium]